MTDQEIEEMMIEDINENCLDSIDSTIDEVHDNKDFEYDSYIEEKLKEEYLQNLEEN
jgi:hypothetical protein